MFWRSPQEQNKLKADTDRAVRNIALFLIFGSLILNLIPWLTMSTIKFKMSFLEGFIDFKSYPTVALAQVTKELDGKSFQELLNLKPLPSIVIGMGIALLYTMWVVKSYQKEMALFKGDPNEKVCAEKKKRAIQKIGLCGTLCLFGWLITAAINYFKG